ncbi:hypothetical protein [Thalassospira marina]|uniref:Uncharacterized protein n=1 Tax=Thalassospira marina TaxID=2048283 RepID=A0A2N3KV35_9PROT|nr:hypothetical protein [Thalassospira marina]PKR54425.1 hypothetical protein COO20_09860 [Thalassospira marina]
MTDKDVGLIKLLFDWQSLIGTAIGTFAAVALFMLQRHNDRKDQTRYRLFTLLSILKKIHKAPSGTELGLTIQTIKNRAKFIPKTDTDLRKPDPVKVTVEALQRVAAICQVYFDQLLTIQRDIYMPTEYTAKVDAIEQILANCISHTETLRQRSNTTDWNDTKNNGPFVIVFEANGICEDVEATLAVIEKLIEQIEADKRLK